MALKSNNAFSRYVKADDVVKPRIIASSQGEVGTGKTQWWLGAPGPIIIQTLDQGLEGVVEPFTREKDIYIADYDLGLTPGESFTHALAVEARDKFVADFEHALTVARTIVWDRESDMWNLFFFAEFGTDDAFAAAPPKDWDKLKGHIRRLISLAKATDVNFGIIRGMKNEWASSINKRTGAKGAAQTGNRVPAGMEDIDALAHIVIEHTRVNGEFAINVSKSRGPGSGEVQDRTFSNITFSEFAQLVFPDSTEEQWR